MRLKLIKLLLFITLVLAVILSGLTEARSDLVRFAINLAVQVYGVLDETNGGTGQSSYTTGDILYASGANTLSKLPLGTNGYVLTVDSGNVSWQPSGGGGVTTIGTIDSQSKSANAAVIVGTDLFFQTADASFPGVVSTGTQTFAGAKTFIGNVDFDATVNVDSLTASLPVKTDVSKNLISGAINLASAEVTGVLAEANGGTDQSTYTTGDILYASAANTLSKLPIGSNGQVLTVNTGNVSWQAATGGITTIGTIDSQTKSANGAVITGSTLVMQTADASNPGLVSTGTQSIAGVKTFTGNTNFSGTVNIASLTASLPVKTDGSKNLSSGAINLASAEVTGTLAEANGGTDQSTYTAGDLLYASAANTLSKLAIGTNGQVLTVNSGNVSWQPATSASTPGGSTGAIQYNNAGAFGGDNALQLDAADNALIFPTWKSAGTLGTAGAGWKLDLFAGFIPMLTPGGTDGSGGFTETLGAISGGLYVIGNTVLPLPSIYLLDSTTSIAGTFFLYDGAILSDNPYIGVANQNIRIGTSTSTDPGGGNSMDRALELGGPADNTSSGGSRGGQIWWFHGDEGTDDETLEGYLFVNTNGDIVFNDAVASSPTDVGKATINLQTGLMSSPDLTFSASNTERFGFGSQAAGDNSTVFGNGAYGDLDSAAFGHNSIAQSTSGPGLGSSAFGVDSFADEGGSAFGNGAIAMNQALAMGVGANATSGMAVGSGAAVTAGINGFALGPLSSCGTSNTMAMGVQASIGTSATRSMAVGVQSSISNSVTDSLALGHDADVAFSQSIGLGSNADPTASGQALIGGSNAGGTQGTFITDVFIGKGVTQSAAPAIVSIHATGGSGTNNAGSNLTINGGRGTGNVSTGGSVVIRTAPPGSSGSTANTLTARVDFKSGTEAAFNDGGVDYNFRFEGDTDADLLSLDASTDRVGIGTGAPNAKLHVSGEVTIGATGSALPASASLDLVATDKAAITNRLTTTNRNALTAVDGMVLYNTTTQTFQGRANSTWVDLSAPSVSNAGSNLIIGGNFSTNPWQRGTNFPVGTGAPYTADRWQASRGGTTGSTVSRTTLSVGDVPGTLHSIRVQRDSGNTSATGVEIVQSIESLISRAAQGQYVTVRFWARKGADFSDVSSQITVDLNSGTGTDQNEISGFTGNASVIGTTTVLTTSWQQFSYTSASTIASSVNQLGLKFGAQFVPFAAGANDWFEVANVELIVGDGSVTAPARDPSTERDLCERYYQKTYLDGVAAGTSTSTGRIQTTTGTTTTGPLTYFHNFNQPLRVSPTLTIYDTVGNSGKVTYWTTTNSNYQAVLSLNEKNFGLEADNSSKTNGDMRFHFEANAEL